MSRTGSDPDPNLGFLISPVPTKLYEPYIGPGSAILLLRICVLIKTFIFVLTYNIAHSIKLTTKAADCVVPELSGCLTSAPAYSFADIELAFCGDC